MEVKMKIGEVEKVKEALSYFKMRPYQIIKDAGFGDYHVKNQEAEFVLLVATMMINDALIELGCPDDLRKELREFLLQRKE